MLFYRKGLQTSLYYRKKASTLKLAGELGRQLLWGICVQAPLCGLVENQDFINKSLIPHPHLSSGIFPARTVWLIDVCSVREQVSCPSGSNTSFSSYKCNIQGAYHKVTRIAFQKWAHQRHKKIFTGEI